MSDPQSLLFISGGILLIAAIAFYTQNKNLAGFSTLIISFFMIFIAAIDPDTLSNAVITASTDSFELNLSRNTPEYTEVALQTDVELDKGNLSEQSQEFLRQSEDSPDAERVAADYLVLATEFWRQGELIDGITSAQQGLRLEPSDTRLKAALLSRMGSLLHDLDSNTTAEQFFSDSIETYPEFDSPYVNLGALLMSLDRYEEAEVAYREAIRIEPEYFGSHYGLGYVLATLGRDEEAVAAYSEAIRIEPEYAASHNNLGILLESIERYEEAENAYREAIRIDPEDSYTYSNLGLLFVVFERYEEAENAYREAIRIDPENAYAYNNLGVLFSKLERYEDAAEAYREAIQLDPENADAKNNLEKTLLIMSP